jgi:hypothetical protein
MARVKLMFDSMTTSELRRAATEAYAHGIEISVRVEGPEGWKAEVGPMKPMQAVSIVKASIVKAVT